MEATVALRTSGPPMGCTIPGYNTVCQLRTCFVQGQHNLSGTLITDPKSASPKQHYSPTSKVSRPSTSGECPQKAIDEEKARRGGARPRRV